MVDKKEIRFRFLAAKFNWIDICLLIGVLLSAYHKNWYFEVAFIFLFIQEVLFVNIKEIEKEDKG